jgi:hypothetical protein
MKTCRRGHPYDREYRRANGQMRRVCHLCQREVRRLAKRPDAPRVRVTALRLAELAGILANQYFLPRAIPLRLDNWRA